MRYLTLAEALVIAGAVTGIDRSTLAKAARLELLDSAIHAPQAGFGDVEFHPEFVDKGSESCRFAANGDGVFVDGQRHPRWDESGQHERLLR